VEMLRLRWNGNLWRRSEELKEERMVGGKNPEGVPTLFRKMGGEPASRLALMVYLARYLFGASRSGRMEYREELGHRGVVVRLVREWFLNRNIRIGLLVGPVLSGLRGA
jgi:hypothetical protein